LNSIYSSASPDFRFKETPYVNFFTDPELSSSLYKGTTDIKLQLHHGAIINVLCSYVYVYIVFTNIPTRVDHYMQIDYLRH